ncbi:MAG TPA: LytTR family DNA-binding domain-containing protein [Chitinophagaceae bacterium]|nr:LytTR family DNA-binding domain-containing protein [Chitinophagaceae bacterium]
MKIVIVEDEKLAAERLITLLREYDSSVEVAACLESIEESVEYLNLNPHPDLLLLDIHLADGHSFEIFRHVNYNRPVIFITAFDQYALDAFQLLSIDYILKPVSLESLAKAMNKYRSLAGTFKPIDFSRLNPGIQQARFKKRFLGKVGQRLFFIDVQDVAFFQADNKIVHLVDKEGNKYLIDHTMEKLEEQLNPENFFRLSRKFIVNIDAIHQVKPYCNSRLKLSVKGAAATEDMVISRDRVPHFKMWAEV